MPPIILRLVHAVAGHPVERHQVIPRQGSSPALVLCRGCGALRDLEGVEWR